MDHLRPAPRYYFLIKTLPPTILLTAVGVPGCPMHLDPLLPSLVGVCLVVLLIGLGLHALKQPFVVAYLIAGAVIGPSGLGLVSDRELIGHLGAIGVVLLLFFVGMEVSPRHLVRNWRVAILGTFVQIGVSVGFASLLGHVFDWPLRRGILLGFVIALSSTAVILKLLKDQNQLETRVGQNVLGILLVQDLAVIPMLVILSFLGGEGVSGGAIALQIIGGAAILVFVAWVVQRESIHLPFASWVKSGEIQIFAAALIPLGFALLTAFLGLSTALGSFVGGILVAAARETKWVCESLEQFRVVFVALFFVSIGMLIDVSFLSANWHFALFLVGAAFVINTIINTITLRVFGDAWPDSLYGGALLSEIGEFSFVLAAIGLQAAIISEFSYQTTIGVIALSLLLSPAWIGCMKLFLKLRMGVTSTDIATQPPASS